MVPSWLNTMPWEQKPTTSFVDNMMNQNPIQNIKLAQNDYDWRVPEFGNISLMEKGNFTGDEANDFIVVNGTDPGMIPVLFDEWEVATGNKIQCLNGSDGTILWSVEVNNTVTDLDVADINGDGYDEVVVSVLRWESTDPLDHNKLDNGGQLFALDRNGLVMWNHSSGQRGAYLSVLGDYNGDGNEDVATVWTLDSFQYNVTVYTAFNGTSWGGYLGTQYVHKSYYDNGTLFSGGTYGYQTVPIQGVAADWDDDGIETLVLQANYDVYNDTAGHTPLESSAAMLFHYEGNPSSVELNSTFGLATEQFGYDFNAPPIVAGDFITESGDRDWIAVVVPVSNTHRVVKILSNGGSDLASMEIARAHTAWLVAFDINEDGIEDLVMTDFLFESYEGFPSPTVVAALDGTDLHVIFEKLSGTNGFQGLGALHVDIGNIDSATNSPEIIVSGMNSLVVFSATGDLVYYEAFEGIGLFSFFSDVDGDGNLEIVVARSSWSMWLSGYTSEVFAATEFVMMIPGSLTADEWFVYANDNATVSAQFIAPFENINGINITLWNATAMPGPGFVDIDLYQPKIDTRLVDLTAGVPYVFTHEWNTSQFNWMQMAFTLENDTSADMAIGVFAIPGSKPTVSYTDYQGLVNKGLRWLLNEQNTEGYWMANTEYNDDSWDAPSIASTAMATIALMNNGTSNNNLTKAIDWILSLQNVTSGAIFHSSQNQTDVVETTWAILALHAYNGTLLAYNATIDGAIADAVDWLISAQYQVGFEYYEEGQPRIVDENSIVYGGWSQRANNTDEPVDIHVTSLALAALNLGGISSPDPVVRAQVFISRSQNHLQTNPIGLKSTDGGFLGMPSRQVGSLGSATGAGLFAMAVSLARDNNPEGYMAAIDWVNNNFNMNEHVGVENYLGGLYFTRMLFISDYWFYLNLGMVLAGNQFNAAQFAELDQAIADWAEPDADDTARWGSFFGGDAWQATAKNIMTLQTRHGPNPGKLRVEMHSDAYLTLVAPDGSTIGYNHTTGSIMTPLGATYSGPESEPQVIEVPNPEKGYWTIVGDGNVSGNFDIIVTTYSSGGNMFFSWPFGNYVVNETTGWEVEFNVFRTVDVIAVVTAVRQLDFDYQIDIALQFVDEPGPPHIGRLQVTASSTDPNIADIEGTEAIEHMWYLYDRTDNSTPLASGVLVWNAVDSRWDGAYALGGLTNGDHYFSVVFRTIRTELTVKNQTLAFTIAHALSFALPTVTYDQDTQTILSGGFAVDSTYTVHGTVDDIEATVYEWYLYDAASGGTMATSGVLTYSSDEFAIGNTTVASLQEGSYYLRVFIVTSQASLWVNGSSVAFVVGHSLILSGDTWAIDAGTVTLSGLTATSSYGSIGIVDNLEAVNSSYYIFTSTGVYAGLSGDLSFDAPSEEWSVSIDVSSLTEGDYYVFAVISDGINEVSTAHFDFTVEGTTTTPPTSTTTTTTTSPTTSPTTPGPLDPTMMILIIGGLGGVVVVVIIVALKKRQS